MIREVKKQISHNAINPHEIAKQDIFIRHYYDNYNTPKMPPSWMVFESISFGTISRIFKNLNKSKTKKICQPLNINHQTLSSWLHSTCYVRNLCAHHHRIWNKTLTITPAISRNHAEKFENNSKIYRVMVVFQIFLEKISLNNNWAELLSELLSEHPGVPIRNMGIPENWREKPFWRLSEAA
jgi:abortive infection bacteriophage resistance protein